MVKVNWQDEALDAIQSLTIRGMLTKQETVNLSLSVVSGLECSDREAGHCPVSSEIRMSTAAWFMNANRRAEMEIDKPLNPYN